jgi:hypothetical protein
MARELGHPPPLAAVEDALAESFARAFDGEIDVAQLAVAGVNDGR